jgi:orotidine-5'-phosphate decarboxylase
MIPAKSANPIFVALDTTDLDDALQLAERLRGHVGGLKLGLEFFCAHGPETA